MAIPSAYSMTLINFYNFFYVIKVIHLFILQNRLNLCNNLNKLVLKRFIKITCNMLYYPHILRKILSHNFPPNFKLSCYRTIFVSL